MKECVRKMNAMKKKVANLQTQLHHLKKREIKLKEIVNELKGIDKKERQRISQLLEVSALIYISI